MKVDDYMKITLEYIKDKILEFYIEKHRFPFAEEYKIQYKLFNFSYATLNNLFNKNDECYRDYLASIDCFATKPPSVKYYKKYVEKLIELCESENLSYKKDLNFIDSNGIKRQLPDIRWFINNCPDKSIKDIESFKRWCGINTYGLTKNECIEQIVKMSNEYNRPLKYDDFRGYNDTHGNTNNRALLFFINKYWGSVNKMKQELGLEIIQDKMIATTDNDIKNTIQIIKQYMIRNNRNCLTTYEWDSVDGVIKFNTFRKYIKNYYNISVKDYLNQHEIEIASPGCGARYTFPDGEVTTSQFEYLFSKYLRNAGYKYQLDYKRNVKYRYIDSDYTGNMDCDYLLNINGKEVYIEIAGIIAGYKKYYYNNITITASNSKETYKTKLKQKERMLMNNNKNYYILFPCDLVENYVGRILESPTVKLRKEIESHNRHNIDWSLIHMAS